MVGIDGTHRDSCIVCLSGTDTAIAFSGEPEWAAAGLVRLGVPIDQAIVTLDAAVEAGLSSPFVIRVCKGCAGEFPVGLVTGDVPVIAQSGGE